MSAPTQQANLEQFLMEDESVKNWRLVAETILQISEEATFTIDGDGIFFRGMDPSHIALIEVKWLSGGFRKFNSKMRQRFAMRLEDFLNILKRAESNDTMTISRVDRHNILVEIKGSRKADFEFRLLDPEKEDCPKPKLQSTVHFKITPSLFQKLLDDSAVLADHIVFESSGQSLECSAKGLTGKVTLSSFNNQELKDLSGAGKAKYSIEYLKKILSPALNKVDELSVSYGTSLPILISYFLGKNRELSIEVFLAPRVLE